MKKVKVKELPAKIKEIKKERKEESLEGDVDEAESERLENFISSGEATVLGSNVRISEGREIPTQNTPESEERTVSYDRPRGYSPAQQEREYIESERSPIVETSTRSIDPTLRTRFTLQQRPDFIDQENNEGFQLVESNQRNEYKLEEDSDIKVKRRERSQE